MGELVHATIKYVMAPLEVGPEFALNYVEGRIMSDFTEQNLKSNLEKNT